MVIFMEIFLISLIFVGVTTLCLFAYRHLNLFARCFQLKRQNAFLIRLLAK